MNKIINKLISIILVCLFMICVFSACGSNNGETVSVQSVAMISGIGSVGLSSRYAGVVVSGKSVDLPLDESMTLNEILVEEGQEVRAGDILFTYDNETLLITIEQSALEIESMKNSIEANRKEIESLTAEKEKASEASKLQYTMQIQTLEVDIREAEYNLKLKEKELSRQQAASENTEVRSEISGRITAINPEGGFDNYGNPKPFMTILETGELRIKGTINEMNMGYLNEGMHVVIRSRTTDDAWPGTISYIDWENVIDNNNDYYYYPADSEMTNSSSYPFYIIPEESDGLFIGQHVYIEPGDLSSDGENTLSIPSYFINDIETSPWVWASGSGDKLEKRNVTLGDFNSAEGTYVIESGITTDDYIAFPDDMLKAGMPTEKYDESMFNDVYNNIPADYSQDEFSDETEWSAGEDTPVSGVESVLLPETDSVEIGG